MRNQYKILAEVYSNALHTEQKLNRVQGKYIYFVDSQELFQLNPYKLIQTDSMIMSLANNWKKTTVIQGEDARDVLGIELKNEELRNWYEVDKGVAPSDHTFEVYIGY